MKRPWAVVPSILVVLAFGCAKRYEYRVNQTLSLLRYEQRLNQFLVPPEAGYRELGIYLRPPRPLSKAQQNLGLPSVNPAQYELVATYADLGGGAADKKSASSALRLYVLARVKRPKKPPKKGEAPPAEAPRGDFASDVRALLAADFGNADVNKTDTVPVKSDKERSNEYKKLVFKASNEDNIRVYFYKQDIYDVALIWDVPGTAEKAPETVTGIGLCLESLAVGPKALRKFEGGGDEESAGPAAEGGAAGAGGQAF